MPGVVVVRGRADQADGPVVVGLDGSPTVEAVLRAGLEYADTRGRDLLVVRAFGRHSDCPVLVVRGPAAFA